MQPVTSVMKASVIWSKIVLIALGRLGVIRTRASLVNGVTKIVFRSQDSPWRTRYGEKSLFSRPCCLKKAANGMQMVVCTPKEKFTQKKPAAFDQEMCWKKMTI